MHPFLKTVLTTFLSTALCAASMQAAKADPCPDLEDKNAWVGNVKPYVLQIDVCEGIIQAFTGDGGAQSKGTKMIGIQQCGGVFNAARADDIGKQILKACPIGSPCRIEGYVPGDDGIQFIVRVSRTNGRN